MVDQRDHDRIEEDPEVDLIAEQMRIGGERAGLRRQAKDEQAQQRQDKEKNSSIAGRQQQRDGAEPPHLRVLEDLAGGIVTGHGARRRHPDGPTRRTDRGL